MFKPHYGICVICQQPKLIVAKNGLCKFHNEEKKNIGKPPKVKKARIIKKKELRYGQCKKCAPNTKGVLETRHLCRLHNFEKKKEEKSKRVVKLVNKAEKKKSIDYLKGELDRVFSLFIRKRDSNKEGYGKCVTCPTIKHYTQMDCGHFITRGAMGIRWHPWNCALQCKICNGFKGGEQDIFRDEINKRWGKNTAENLQIKRHFTKKLDRFVLEFLIRDFEEKTKQLDTR